MKAWLFQDTRQKLIRGDNCPWSVGWYDPDGRKRSKTIGTKSNAEKFRERIEQASLVELTKSPSDMAEGFNMPPVPSPQEEITRWGSPSIPELPGVYFVFAGKSKRCVYVGESVNLFNRLRLSHGAIEPGDRVSFLTCDFTERVWWECFYLWLLRPERNGQARKSINKQSGISA